MITARDLRNPLNWTVAGLSVLDLAAAAVLSAYAVGLTSGAVHTSHPHGGVGASIGVLAMTMPLAWRRRSPLGAAEVMVAAAVLNGLAFGSMVRCGAALPALFLVTFAVGARYERARSAAGLLLSLGVALAEGLYDPQIGAQGQVVVLPVLVPSSARTSKARCARRSTAARTAATGLGALGADQAAARQALGSIERDGRAVLTHLRAVLGALHEPAPSEPPPTLARLSGLLARATTADARLTVVGSARTLPAGLELSGYRIVEHLLLALEDAPEAAVDVRLAFGPDALELHVSGPPSPTADLRAVLAAARERACLHGGTVDSQLAGGVCYVMARLPLVSGHA